VWPAQPVSDRVLSAAHVENGRVTSRTLKPLPDCIADSRSLSESRRIGLVRLYHRVVQGVDAFVGFARHSAIAPEQSRNAASAPATLPSRWIAAPSQSRLAASLPLLLDGYVSLSIAQRSRCLRRVSAPTVTMSHQIALAQGPWSKASRIPAGMVPAVGFRTCRCSR